MLQYSIALVSLFFAHKFSDAAMHVFCVVSFDHATRTSAQQQAVFGHQAKKGYQSFGFSSSRFIFGCCCGCCCRLPGVLLTAVFAGPRVRSGRGVLATAYQVALLRPVLLVHHQRGAESLHHRPQSTAVVLEYEVVVPLWRTVYDQKIPSLGIVLVPNSSTTTTRRRAATVVVLYYLELFVGVKCWRTRR